MRAIVLFGLVLLCSSCVASASAEPADTPRSRVCSGGAPFSGTYDTFTSTSSTINVCQGTANFSCPNNPGTSSPCLANFNDVLEISGSYHGTPQGESASVYVASSVDRDGGAVLCVMNNYGACGGGSEICELQVRYNGDSWLMSDLWLNKKIGTDGRINSTAGPLYRIAPAQMYTWNTGSTDIETWFTGGGGTQKMVLKANGALTLATGPARNTCTLNGASPSTCTVTVEASAICDCTPVGTSATIAAGGCSVSLASTTLTVTGPNGATNVVNVLCH